MHAGACTLVYIYVQKPEIKARYLCQSLINGVKFNRKRAKAHGTLLGTVPETVRDPLRTHNYSASLIPTGKWRQYHTLYVHSPGRQQHAPISREHSGTISCLKTGRRERRRRTDGKIIIIRFRCNRKQISVSLGCSGRSTEWQGHGEEMAEEVLVGV